MNYREAVDYIHSLLRFGIKPGLERVSMLLHALGDPQDKIKTIHVAGTNGKGSTSTHLANILSSAGYKTGLYTSPYVLSFCERIQIDGEIISERNLAKTVEKVKKEIEKLNQKGVVITEFEAITATAFLYFYESGCDFAVIEVGLGGRFDATNVIKHPETVVITSISLDHTDILGDTVEKIALEKCGVIKENTKVITSLNQTNEALTVIKKTAKEKRCELTVSNPGNAEIVSDMLGKTVFNYDGAEYVLRLNGMHQIENAVNAAEAAKSLKINESAIIKGLSQTKILARMEIIGTEPLVIRDGGHNEGCAWALRDFILRYNIKNIKMLVGLMADKDTEKYLEIVCPLCDSVLCCTPSNPRAEKAENLLKSAKKYCDKCDFIDDPKTAYSELLKTANKTDTVLICGSFYLMSDIF